MRVALKGTNTQHKLWVKTIQTEILVEINSKSPVRPIGKVLLIEFS